MTKDKPDIRKKKEVRSEKSYGFFCTGKGLIVMKLPKRGNHTATNKN